MSFCGSQSGGREVSESQYLNVLGLGTGVPVLDILSVTPAGSVLQLCNWLDFPLSEATL